MTEKPASENTDPEKPKNWLQRYQAWGKKTDRKLFAAFYRTKFGKKWAAFDDRIDKLKYGSFIKATFGIGMALLVLFGTQSLFFNWQVSSFDVQLTESQIDEGYEQTIASSGRSSRPDDVAYRFMTDAEEQNTPECEGTTICWDILAIPQMEGCQSIHVKMDFFTTDNFAAAPIESDEQSFKADGTEYVAGKVYEFRLAATKQEVMYASMDRVYCEDFGG
jgi:hypothetical protein